LLCNIGSTLREVALVHINKGGGPGAHTAMAAPTPTHGRGSMAAPPQCCVQSKKLGHDVVFVKPLLVNLRADAICGLGAKSQAKSNGVGNRAHSHHTQCQHEELHVQL